jgi:hypothetical protein
MARSISRLLREWQRFGHCIGRLLRWMASAPCFDGQPGDEEKQNHAQNFLLLFGEVFHGRVFVFILEPRVRRNPPVRVQADSIKEPCPVSQARLLTQTPNVRNLPALSFGNYARKLEEHLRWSI